MKTRIIGVVGAFDENGVYGIGLNLPWGSSDGRSLLKLDMGRFVEVTRRTAPEGKRNVLVIGRGTAEAMGMSPLPGRHMIVISNTLNEAEINKDRPKEKQLAVVKNTTEAIERALSLDNRVIPPLALALGVGTKVREGLLVSGETPQPAVIGPGHFHLRRVPQTLTPSVAEDACCGLEIEAVAEQISADPLDDTMLRCSANHHAGNATDQPALLMPGGREMAPVVHNRAAPHKVRVTGVASQNRS